MSVRRVPGTCCRGSSCLVKEADERQKVPWTRRTRRTDKRFSLPSHRHVLFSSDLLFRVRSSAVPSALLGVAIFVFANALYVAAEFGAVGVRRSRIRRMAEDGNWLAQRLLPFLETPAGLDRYVGVSQIGITLSSLMLGAYAQATISVQLAPLVDRWFSLDPRDRPVGTRLSCWSCSPPSSSILGELVPKALALQFPTQTALGNRSADAMVARGVPAVPRAAQRRRPSAVLRVVLGSSEHGASAPALAGRDRAPDRREPRRRSARTRGAATAASRAAARTAGPRAT